MKNKDVSIMTRRGFIRQAACAALGTGALTSAIGDLRFINSAAAQSAASDYKALVCIFLSGGNDSNNLIIPTIQSEYEDYAAIRSDILALPISGAPNVAIPLSPLSSDGHEYGLHPACPELATLFGENKLAVLFNTGTLVFPMTRAQYQSGILRRPPQLFSHSDQVTQWQTSIPDRPPVNGWGGRCADLLAAVQPGAPISMSITVAGANTFEVGNVVSQYSVTTSGAINLSSVTGARLQSLTNLLALPYPNLQVQAYADVGEHAIQTGGLLNSAITPTAAATYWNTPFRTTITSPTGGNAFGSGLASQLRMIARLIEAGSRSAANGGFGMKRQIFFCQVGGYDTHSGQTQGSGLTTIGSHANLLAELSQGMNSFQRAMEQLGLSNNVTSFTASDFGRTFPGNGGGSDHGWGSHHLIMGGAVNGRRTYGRFPTLAVNGPDDTSTGRWIPTTAIDQYFATLATWFGVDNSNLAVVFPNLGRFSTPNLGFI
ncbi:MAG TPA: DUF1501 domain-containing protein [Methylomirabilota bacterium]|nr:DUF1501 domain-containing protein [Methylomirabilota bacterium]